MTDKLINKIKDMISLTKYLQLGSNKICELNHLDYIYCQNVEISLDRLHSCTRNRYNRLPLTILN